MNFVPFADFTHGSVPRVPASAKTTLVALYATGSGGIAATAADIAKYAIAGTGVILIDQSPSANVFAAGITHVVVIDEEKNAATLASVAAAIMARQAKGLASTVYCSRSAIPATKAAFHPNTNRELVTFGVADWSLSQTAAELLLSANPDWAYVQYGDPASNPRTLVPGTGVTLRQANADINVARLDWATQFMPLVQVPGTLFGPTKSGTGYRWVSDGTMSLAAFAAKRGASSLGLLKVSAESLNAKNYGALNEYVSHFGVGALMPKGLVFYTANP